ncbi:ty3-gypsy retroelement transposase [Cucumis melo var. makuwa]|nr:ty3-gypsy retroelement transposase [Cucumis melo var. makuwa]
MYIVKNDDEEFEIIEDTNYEEKELKMVRIVEEDQTVIQFSCGPFQSGHHEKKLTNELQLITKDTSHYGVILGFGAAIKGKGICESMEIIMSEWKVVADLLPLELGGVDVELGMQWLYSLGNAEVDRRNLTTTFLHQGRKIVIKGDPSLNKASVSLKNMIKSWEDSNQGFLVECRSMEGNDYILGRE